MTELTREEEKRLEKEKIQELYSAKKAKELIQLLQDMNVVDIAEILDEMDKKDATVLFRMLPKDIAVDVFTYFDSEQQEDIISSSSDIDVEYILKEMFFDDKIDMLEEMPANIVDKILERSTQEERALINQFLNYPEDSAGSIMTIEYASLKKNITVREAMQRLKKVGLERETIYTIYVVDENRKLEGIVSLRQLVTADDDTKISDLMNEDVVYANVYDDQESVAHTLKKYDFVAIPVVDNESRLVGLVTFDDVLDIIEREATEDFQKMAAMSPNEVSYLQTPAYIHASKRIVWLLVLMISATLTGTIITSYEKILEKVSILMAFVPMLMDTGGNAGSQSATLIIRGLATGEVQTKDIFRIIWKEFKVSVLVGIVLVSVNYARVRLMHGVSPSIAITTSIAMFATIIMSKFIGGVLPILAKDFGMDPAIMASPLITTIVDASSLMVYFYVAKLVLKI